LLSFENTVTYGGRTGAFYAVNYNFGGVYNGIRTIYNNSGIIDYGKTSIVNNTWTHVAVVFSSTYIRTYINGSLSNTTATSTSINYANWFTNGKFTPLIIGKVVSEGGTNFTGYIDDWRLYSMQLNDAQINAIYNGTL
jgi:hypothetical protein